MKNKILAAMLAVVLPISLTNPAAAADKTATTTAPASASAEQKAAAENLDPKLKGKAEEMEKTLNVINSIPDDVLAKGDKATQEWLEKDPKAQELTEEASVWGCTKAIGALLITSLVPAGKLLKLKRYIKELGGVKEAVKAMWGAGFSYEKMIHSGNTLGMLAAELVGISQVRDQCFN